MNIRPLPFLLLAGSLAFLALAEPAADFTLPRHGTNGVVKLLDYAGKIVVLDFFAYWCTPCGEASSTIHREIGEHYAAKGGNSNGVPVEVIAVNVEADNPGETVAFIRRHGLVNVADDPTGKTFDAYKGSDLPLVVIIDGTGGTRSKPKFSVVYRRAGFEGGTKLRAVIDAVPAPDPKPEEETR
jgi:peroxiredoxin